MFVGLQPQPGQFATSSDAVAAFLRSEQGWQSHEAGWIVMHQPLCSFAGDPDDRCDCEPTIVAAKQGRRPA